MNFDDRWWLRVSQPPQPTKPASSAQQPPKPTSTANPPAPAFPLFLEPGALPPPATSAAAEHDTEHDDEITMLGTLPGRLAADSTPPPRTLTPDTGPVVPINRLRGTPYTWPQFLRSLEEVMGDDTFASAIVTVHERAMTPVRRYAIDLTLLDQPRWIISTLAPTVAQARVRRLSDAGWFLWADPNRVDWTRPKLLAAPGLLTGRDRTLLAVYKTASKRAAVRALIASLQDDGAAQSAVAVEVMHVGEQRVERRRAWTHRISSTVPRRPRGRVLGKCAICGQPLTTQESARIGIGPLCLERLRETRGLPPDVRNRPSLLAGIVGSDLPVSYWIRAVPAKRWAASITRRLSLD
ncbi:DUF6011 domain-containing protein [Georgenia thermotolerans]|uniref:Uncharacterized protein n=2 Tax=Georgenia thermotolerans TaxID=527326 RepID=A0A7J5UTJ2_9MICO|nr:DUF6011 domain-containing protein [Georgenia thermotolerans]KAE8765592.1 hypothetical protein GB883_02785 [Georgenia thermotolerans]